MKILALSDVELNYIYSPAVANRFRDVQVVISCGDLPHFYLEYVISMLDIPLYFVHGNHTGHEEQGSGILRSEPWGGKNLHLQALRDESGILLAGIEGSLQYNFGPHQYTQGQMWLFAFGLVPKLLINKMRYGRYLDIFVTHAPPWKVHDMEDLPHRGAKAFRWVHRVFHPIFHIHGHVHVYRPDTVVESVVNGTRVVNAFGHREIDFDLLRKTP